MKESSQIDAALRALTARVQTLEAAEQARRDKRENVARCRQRQAAGQRQFKAFSDEGAMAEKLVKAGFLSELSQDDIAAVDAAFQAMIDAITPM